MALAVIAIEVVFRGLFVGVYYAWMAAATAGRGTLVEFVRLTPTVVEALVRSDFALPPLAPLVALETAPVPIVTVGLYGLAFVVVWRVHSPADGRDPLS